MALVTCPFCRELYARAEQTTCTVCQLPLVPMHTLPPSLDALGDDPPAATTADLERKPLYYLGRGKGVVAACALVGMAMFFAPWISLTMPYESVHSAFDLARGRNGWLWACFAAWMVLVPTVMSRRTAAAMRGARVASLFLSLIPALCVAILVVKPPRASLVPLRFSWLWPLWATVAVASVSSAASLVLGGRAGAGAGATPK